MNVDNSRWKAAKSWTIKTPAGAARQTRFVESVTCRVVAGLAPGVAAWRTTSNYGADTAAVTSFVEPFATAATAGGATTSSPSAAATAVGGLGQREGGAREFVFTSADFERVRKLIYQHAGISLSPAKQDMVYSRLARRLRATNKNSFGDYLEMLEKGNSDEWERFVNSLTTNLTSFFQEPHHFPILPST